jgi:hypothetical protein
LVQMNIYLSSLSLVDVFLFLEILTSKSFNV